MAKLICPKCGASDHKPALDVHSIAIGTFQHKRECRKCGYVGVFFLKE
jgi:predicted RNA-binding Zn-ribbon protein involved in translation (DUF1610 family)